MNTADKIKVMQAYLDGAEIEISEKGRCCWRGRTLDYELVWDWSRCDYRIKEKDYPLDIPWGVIEDKWQYAAMDGDGKIYLYTEHTGLRTDYWVSGSGAGVEVGCLRIKKPDVKHWEKTLTKRPEEG